MAKIYELTTNARDGYTKFWVVGVNSDKEAKNLAKRGFGEYYWEYGISFYDRTEDARGKEKYWMTKQEFMKETKRYRTH